MPVTIHIALLNMAPPAWRAVQAERRGDGSYVILSRNDDPEDEQWEFSSGSIVRCESRPTAHGTVLVAVERMAPPAPRRAWPP